MWLKLSKQAGFAVHPDNVIVIQSHTLLFLGFTLNTIDIVTPIGSWYKFVANI